MRFVNLFQTTRYLRPLTLVQRRSFLQTVTSRIISPFIGATGLTGFIVLETAVVMIIHSIMAVLPSVLVGIYPTIAAITSVSAPVIREIINTMIPTSPQSLTDLYSGIVLYYGAIALQGFGVWTLTAIGHNWEIIHRALHSIFTMDVTLWQRSFDLLVFLPMSVFHFGLLPIWELVQLLVTGSWDQVSNSTALNHILWIGSFIEPLFGWLGGLISSAGPPIKHLLGGIWLGLSSITSLANLILGSIFYLPRVVIEGIITFPITMISWGWLWFCWLIGL